MQPSKPLSINSAQETNQLTTKSQEDAGFDYNRHLNSNKKANGEIDAVVSASEAIKDRNYSGNTPMKVERAHESERSAPQELRKNSANRHDRFYEKSIDGNQRPSNKIIKLGSSNRPYSNSSQMSPRRPKQKNPNIVR